MLHSRPSLMHLQIFSTVVRNVLPDWVLSCEATSSLQSKYSVSQFIYASGIDCLYHLEILRDPKLEDTLFDSFGKVDSEVILPFLPRLYQSHVESTKKNRGTLFAQDSKHRLNPLDEFRNSALHLFESYFDMLSEDKLARHPILVWRARSALLNSVDQNHLYNDQQNEAVFKKIIQTVLFELNSVQTG
jgi:hypothetical protein